MDDDLVLPDYGGRLHHQHRAGAARAARRRARVVPGRCWPTPTRSCCSSSTAWAGSSCRPGVASTPTLAAMDGRLRSPPWRRPPPPPRSPRSRPGCRRASTASSATAWPSHGEVLNVLRWSTAAGDARQSIPPEQVPADAAVPRRAPAGGHPGRVRTVRLHRRPPRPGAASRLPHAVDDGHRGRPAAAGGRAVRVRLLRRARQGRPRVRPGRALRRRAHLDRPHRSTASWPCCPAGRRWSSRPTTARSTSATTSSSSATRCWRLCSMQSGEGRFRWLHARRGGRRRCCDAAPAATRDDAWVVTREQAVGDGLVRARWSPTRRWPASATSPWSPGATSPSTTRRTPGRTTWSAGTAALTSAEMLRPAPRRRRADRVAGWPASSVARQDDPTRPDGPPTVPSPEGEPAPQVEHGEVVTAARAADGDQQTEAVEQPAKVMRIGSMIKLLLEEVRQTDTELDEASRDRLREIYETSVGELSSALSPDLRDELGRLAHPFAGRRRPAAPSCASPRPSWSGGSRACSTASRPPCSPSRWRPASSSTTCGAGFRRARRRRAATPRPGPGTYL